MTGERLTWGGKQAGSKGCIVKVLSIKVTEAYVHGETLKNGARQ